MFLLFISLYPSFDLSYFGLNFEIDRTSKIILIYCLLILMTTKDLSKLGPRLTFIFSPVLNRKSLDKDLSEILWNKKIVDEGYGGIRPQQYFCPK